MPQYAPMVLNARGKGGGAIPTDGREQQVQKPNLTARYDSDYIRGISAAASENGRALGELGDAIGRGLGVMGKIVDDYYRGQINLDSAEYKRRMNQFVSGKDGLLSRVGEDAFDVDEAYRQEAVRQRAMLLKNRSAFVRGMVDHGLKDFDSQNSIRLQQHGMSEFKKFTQAGQNAAIGDALDAMKTTGDIAEFRKNLAMVRYQTIQKYSDMGLSGEALDRAVKMDVSKALGEAIQAKLAQGDQAGAEMLYSLYGGGLTPEGTFQGLAGNSGLAPGNGRTIAEACRNPLNLKKPGHNGRARSDYQVFRNYAEGYVGCWRQLQLYQKRGLVTPRAMVGTWAPASDGNNLKKYFETLQSYGIDIDAPVDMADPKQAALLLKAMSAHEGPVGNMFTTAEIYQMITTGRMPAGREEPAGGPEQAADAGAAAVPEGAAAGGPTRAGDRMVRGAGLLTPDDDARVVRSLEIGRENARKKAEADAKDVEQALSEARVARGYDQVRQDLDNATQFTAEDKLAKIETMTSEKAMPDLTPQERDTLRKQLAAYVQEQENQRKATDALGVSSFNRLVMTRDDMSLRQKRNAVLQSSLSGDAKAFLCAQIDKTLNGEENRQQSSADLLRFMIEYDRRGAAGMTEGEAARLAMEYNLSTADWNSAMEYRGLRREYPISRINPIIDRVYGKNLPNMDRAEIWATVLRAMGDQRWDNRQIEDWLREVAAAPRDRRAERWTLSFGGQKTCETLLEHYAHGTEGMFRPEIPQRTKDDVTRDLEQSVNDWTRLTQECRDILITNQVLLSDYGITPVLYPDEEKILRRNGLWPLTQRNY